MLFWKRNKKGAAYPPRHSDQTQPDGQRELHFIDYDMMLKGSKFMRKGKPIRQFGVTVRGATMLVTSGDTVDRATYEALLAANAIRPMEPAATREAAEPEPARAIPED